MLSMIVPEMTQPIIREKAKYILQTFMRYIVYFDAISLRERLSDTSIYGNTQCVYGLVLSSLMQCINNEKSYRGGVVSCESPIRRTLILSCAFVELVHQEEDVMLMLNRHANIPAQNTFIRDLNGKCSLNKKIW